MVTIVLKIPIKKLIADKKNKMPMKKLKFSLGIIDL